MPPPPMGFNLSRRAAVDLRLRPRGHWDRQRYCIRYTKLNLFSVYCVKRCKLLAVCLTDKCSTAYDNAKANDELSEQLAEAADDGDRQ